MAVFNLLLLHIDVNAFQFKQFTFHVQTKPAAGFIFVLRVPIHFN